MPDRDATLLRWGDHILEAAHAPAFAEGAKVSWVIPPGEVILHRRDRPSRGERENPVSGRIEEMIALGENAGITMRVDQTGDATLTFVVPLHVARRNGLDQGAPVAVSLVKTGIHCMPWEGSAA